MNFQGSWDTFAFLLTNSTCVLVGNRTAPLKPSKQGNARPISCKLFGNDSSIEASFREDMDMKTTSALKDSNRNESVAEYGNPNAGKYADEAAACDAGSSE